MKKPIEIKPAKLNIIEGSPRRSGKTCQAIYYCVENGFTLVVHHYSCINRRKQEAKEMGLEGLRVITWGDLLKHGCDTDIVIDEIHMLCRANVRAVVGTPIGVGNIQTSQGNNQ